VDAVSGLTSVIVVAYNSGTLLADCVASVLASSAPVELIISDNASSDGSVAAIAARWRDDTRLRVVYNDTNLGFGTACNRAGQVARGDVLLFLNPDCRLDAGTIAQLRVHLDSASGLIGAMIVGSDGRPERASRRRDPLLRRALATESGLSHFEGKWPALAGVNLPWRDDAPSLEDVEAVSGALMLVSRVAFERVSGFDTGYFLHCEDLDLCRRLRDAGLRVVCANDVRVTHAKGSSSRTRPFFVARHKHRGMWRWFTKFDPAARNPILRALMWCGLWLHYGAMTPFYALRWLSARLSGSD
jgi:GT2 family glycosyltransferase